MKEWPKNVRPLVPGLVFVADAIGRGDVDPVGDGVAPLNRAPRLHLGAPPFVLFGRMPADRGRVEQDLRAEQRRDARGFGYHWSQQIKTPMVA